MRILKPFYLAVSAAALIAGCGFRLAGRENLPPVMAKPYLLLKDSYSDFAHELTRELESSGAALQTNMGDATITIDVTRDDVRQQVLSVSAGNIPIEYELTYTVIFAARDAKSELLAPQTLSLQRDYSFDETALLAKEHEADILKLQMARDLAAIVTRRLTSLKQ